jgi:hypothetical protein
LHFDVLKNTARFDSFQISSSGLQLYAKFTSDCHVCTLLEPPQAHLSSFAFFFHSFTSFIVFIFSLLSLLPTVIFFPSSVCYLVLQTERREERLNEGRRAKAEEEKK